MNIESELTKTVNETKNYHSTFLCFCQCSDKKVGISCSELSTILKNLPLSANHDGVSGWPSTWHNSSNAQIRALDQPLIKDEHSRKIHNCMTGNVKEPDLSLIFFKKKQLCWCATIVALYKIAIKFFACSTARGYYFLPDLIKIIWLFM